MGVWGGSLSMDLGRGQKGMETPPPLRFPPLRESHSGLGEGAQPGGAGGPVWGGPASPHVQMIHQRFRQPRGGGDRFPTAPLCGA